LNATPQLLGGRYEVGELIGRGGMAEVHLGYDTRLSRQVAIKMLRSDLARDQMFLARFRREAQSAAGLNHASIVAVYDSGEEQLRQPSGVMVDVPYIVMEYVQGRTLREILQQRGRMEPDVACRVTEGILDALAYSHHMGIVHRDIKPANVMLTDTGGVKVMDFGIARAVADTNATMTQTQAVIGTAQYLSPEQAQGQHVDARSDLYSTGCLLFELLTGRTPFLGETPVSVAYQHVSETPPRPSTYNYAVSWDLDAVVLQALAKDRDRRYQDAMAFRADLQAARLGRPISDGARAAALGLGAAAAGAATTMALGQSTLAGPQPGTVPTTVLSPTQAADEIAAQYDDTTMVTPTSRANREEPPRRRSAWPYVLLTLAAVAALALVALFARNYLSDSGGTTMVAVPDVVGKDVEVAKKQVSDAGLVPVVENKANDKQPEGVVFEQVPAFGSADVPRGSKVTLLVSAGPDSVKVPDLIGFTEDEARTELENLGLEVGTVRKVANSGKEKGTVVRTVPGANADVAKGSKVSLDVSNGKVRIPGVVGLQLSEARRILIDAGLNPRTKYVDSSKPENEVIDQDPKADTMVNDGSAITLTVAQAAPPTQTSTTTSPSPTSTTSSPTSTKSP
jgi:eukaryotic-like serine/threonine-protein kinase